MKYDPNKHHRRSIRLKGYDYAQAGAYFVTICTRNRKCLFGKVVDGIVQLNAYGEIVRDEWLRTADIRPNVELDTFVVMPNHIHGIIVLATTTTGARCMVGARCNVPLPVWQRNYYEHIICNEESLNRIRQYILDNPLRWAMDRENPNAIEPEPEEA